MACCLIYRNVQNWITKTDPLSSCLWPQHTVDSTCNCTAILSSEAYYPPLSSHLSNSRHCLAHFLVSRWMYHHPFCAASSSLLSSLPSSSLLSSLPSSSILSPLPSSSLPSSLPSSSLLSSLPSSSLLSSLPSSSLLSSRLSSVKWNC